MGTFPVRPAARCGVQTVAVVFDHPGTVDLRELPLPPLGKGDVAVEIDWTGVSTGTERLLWAGTMPHFPGLGYPLVPGYEAVGRVTAAGDQSAKSLGQKVFVPGAACFGEVRGLFGGAASRLIVPADRVIPVPDELGERAILLALAATAYHAAWGSSAHAEPELIVGHGALGRLLARLAVHFGGTPTVWETNPDRRSGAHGYQVLDPAEDPDRRFHSIYDVSGDAGLLDRLISRLAPGGEVVLAGFYHQPLQFQFAPAFMREARIRVAAEWRPADLAAVTALATAGRFSLDNLITHRVAATEAPRAYAQAFTDPSCVKMVLDWRQSA